MTGWRYALSASPDILFRTTYLHHGRRRASRCITFALTSMALRDPPLPATHHGRLPSARLPHLASTMCWLTRTMRPSRRFGKALWRPARLVLCLSYACLSTAYRQSMRLRQSGRSGFGQARVRACLTHAMRAKALRAWHWTSATAGCSMTWRPGGQSAWSVLRLTGLESFA